jgi:hypothetical protein
VPPGSSTSRASGAGLRSSSTSRPPRTSAGAKRASSALLVAASK